MFLISIWLLAYTPRWELYTISQLSNHLQSQGKKWRTSILKDIWTFKEIREWTDPITGHQYKPHPGYDTNLQCFKPTTAKSTKIAGICYLDFETYPEALTNSWCPFEEKSFELIDTTNGPQDSVDDCAAYHGWSAAYRRLSWTSMEPSIHLVFDPRQFDINSPYMETVNRC